jgi:hypothetical protein
MSLNSALRRGAVAVGLAAIAATSFAPTSASATAWDPHVKLQGTAMCAGNGATWVWIEASNGERAGQVIASRHTSRPPLCCRFDGEPLGVGAREAVSSEG